jgi:ATP-dependent Clp protease ATP-binding subunit ClpB
VELTEAAREHIIEAAYDPIYGARPLKRYMQSELETLIAREIIASDIAPESRLLVDYRGGFVVSVKG